MPGNAQTSEMLPETCFQMEDRSLLTVASLKREGEMLQRRARDGDIVIFLARDTGNMVALLQPAGRDIRFGIIENAVTLTAACLRRKRRQFDHKQNGVFLFSVTPVPAPLGITIIAGPASSEYFRRRSQHPTTKKKSARTLTTAISARIKEGHTERALELADEVLLLPPELQHEVASGIVRRFARTAREIEKEGTFLLPRLLAGHRTLVAVLEKIHPRRDVRRALISSGRAMVASVKGDQGEARDVIMDLFAAIGHEVIDGGANAEPAEIVERVASLEPRLLVVCALLTTSSRDGRDHLGHVKTCRKSVEELMRLLEKNDLRSGMEVIFLGFIFNKKFVLSVGGGKFYRSLNSLLLGLFHP